jgi:2-(1,2-epoxy-1,2-dihydrophenyl)acetyl-CoA isomerase
MQYNTLTYVTDGPVGIITFDRPDIYNAMNGDLCDDMNALTPLIEQDDAIRVVIVKGSGRGFSAGGDLKELDHDPISDLIKTKYKPFIEAAANSDKLYIAQVHGAAAGIAAGFAMSCDFITMADNAVVYMPFAAIGLVPGGGNTLHLLNAMGYRRALQTIVEGAKINAEDCMIYGIASKLFTPEELDAKTLEWAQSLSKRASLSVSASKRLLRGMTGRTLGDAIDAESHEQDALARSQDFQRGKAAFLAKEKPVFQGN